MSFAYHTKDFAYAAGVRFVYNETKPQPRIWRSATEASDHLPFRTNERG